MQTCCKIWKAKTDADIKLKQTLTQKLKQKLGKAKPMLQTPKLKADSDANQSEKLT
jgi:hypothetical protein